MTERIRVAPLAGIVVGVILLGMTPGAGRAAPAVATADSMRLDLTACLAHARAHAPSLAAAAAAGEEARAAAAEAAARRLPVVGASGGYQYTSEHMRQELVVGFGLPTRVLEFGDGHVADVNVGVAIPVYTGGELERTAAAAAAGAAATDQRELAAGLDLDRGVRLAFSGALGRQAQVEAADLAVTRLSRHLANVDGARAAGAATGEAVLRARARLVQATQRQVAAVAARDSATLALGRLVGRPGNAVMPLGDVSSTLLEAGEARADADSLAGTTGGRDIDRPDLVALAHEARRQRELAAAARGRLHPRVLADVRAHYARPGVNALANEWMGYGTAGISLDWPLWDGGARRDRARQADARATWLESQRRDLAESVVTARATARAALDAARVQEGQAAQRAALQHDLLAMVEGRYREAAATETEYLDAQDDLAQAEIELVLARTRVRQAEANLLWTLGR